MLDALALREAHAVLLSTERTPRDMTCPELFRSDNLPAIFSDNWRAPVSEDSLYLNIWKPAGSVTDTISLT